MSSSAPAEQLCDEKARLLQEYQAATDKYSGAVRTLAQTVGNVSKEEYERLRKTTEKARHTANDARGLLDLHVSRHGC
jgi:ABC-type transporter Mla subunit MlaD